MKINLIDETAKLYKVTCKNICFSQKLINTRYTNYSCTFPDNKNAIMYMFLSFTELSGGKSQLIFPIEKLNLKDKEAAVRYMNEHTEDVCKNLSHRFSSWPFGKFTFDFLIRFSN